MTQRRTDISKGELRWSNARSCKLLGFVRSGEMKFATLITALGTAICSGETAAVGFNPRVALKDGMAREFLSVTIDTASIYSLFDFTNPTLINLVKQIAPAVVRIGKIRRHQNVRTCASSFELELLAHTAPPRC